MSNPLAKIRRTRRKRHMAEQAFLDAIREAVEAGESKTACAQAAGVTRPTLYDLLKKGIR